MNGHLWITGSSADRTAMGSVLFEPSGSILPGPAPPIHMAAHSLVKSPDGRFIYFIGGHSEFPSLSHTSRVFVFDTFTFKFAPGPENIHNRFRSSVAAISIGGVPYLFVTGGLKFSSSFDIEVSAKTELLDISKPDAVWIPGM